MNAQIKPQIRIEPATFTRELGEEAMPLLRAHWKEIATYQDEIPLDVDWGFYERMRDQGKLFCITARVGHELVGYSVFLILRTPHYLSTVFALNDVIFVREDMRNSRLGLALIRASEREAKHMGARKLTWHCKVSNDVAQLLRRLGYRCDEVIMGKLL